MAAAAQEAQLVLRGSIKEVILAFYDQWVVSQCLACSCKWDTSLFLETAPLQLLSNADSFIAEGPYIPSISYVKMWTPDLFPDIPNMENVTVDK